MGLEKVALKATIISAIVNISINFLLLPFWHEIGAAITTVLAEAITFIYCFIKSRGIMDYINYDSIKKNFVHSIIGCIEIAITVLTMRLLCTNQCFILGSSIICSGIVYAISLALLKNSYIEAFIHKLRK